VTLRTELDAFYLDHRRCGELEAGVEGPTVWFDCECDARIARRADDGDVLDVEACAAPPSRAWTAAASC
jgi:hypothetical protein